MYYTSVIITLAQPHAQHTYNTISDIPTHTCMHTQVITGAGRHSVNNVPIIKNAVLAFLREESLRHNVDPTNEGVVLVHLT